MKKTTLVYLICALFLSGIPFAHADETSPSYEFEASVGAASINRDLSFSAFEKRLEVGLPAGQLKNAAVVHLSEIHETTAAPSGFNPAPLLYQIDIPASAFAAGRYFISIKSSGSAMLKQLYFYDKNSAEGWRPLPTNENFGKGVVSTYATLPFMRLALFESKSVLVKGKASWYRYKNGLFAASPDFPMGTRLRVINTDNRKSVDVIVNDHGPDRSKHPDRVVDLDAVAFARLASLGQGTMNVAVERLPDNISIPTPAPQNPSEISVSAKAAVIFNSADKKIVWSKEQDTTLPLASLTKLVAAKVFLETKPDLKKTAAYSVKDEQFNNLYVPANQSARLRLKDKDIVTVKDLLYSSLIGSTNNTVESLVRLSGLSREAFIARMNKRVRDWGATKTRFIEPTGLSSKNVTTAKEYVIIAREAFLDPIIASATTAPSYSVTTINTKVTHSFKNTNPLARTANSGLLGSKTGYLDEAGHCLVTKWPTPQNKNLIVVLFGEPSLQKSVDDTKTLLAFSAPLIK